METILDRRFKISDLTFELQNSIQNSFNKIRILQSEIHNHLFSLQYSNTPLTIIDQSPARLAVFSVIDPIITTSFLMIYQCQ